MNFWFITVFHVKRQSEMTFSVYSTEKNTSQKFHLITQEMSWLEAQSYCRENHTDLISGQNQLGANEVRYLVNHSKINFIFMGLFRDTWRWSDGSSFSFRYWSLQFDNEQHKSSKCAMIAFDENGRWRNEDCGVKKHFICYDGEFLLEKDFQTFISNLGSAKYTLCDLYV